MRERGQSRVVESRDEQPDGDAHRLLHIVVLHLAPIGQYAIAQGKHRDHARRDLEEGFVLVRPQRRRGVQPLPRRAAVVERALLFLSGLADAALQLGISDRHEVPRLHVGAAGSGAGGTQGLLDDVLRDWARREVPH